MPTMLTDSGARQWQASDALSRTLPIRWPDLPTSDWGGQAISVGALSQPKVKQRGERGRDRDREARQPATGCSAEMSRDCNKMIHIYFYAYFST